MEPFVNEHLSSTTVWGNVFNYNHFQALAKRPADSLLSLVSCMYHVGRT